MKGGKKRSKGHFAKGHTSAHKRVKVESNNKCDTKKVVKRCDRDTQAFINANTEHGLLIKRNEKSEITEANLPLHNDKFVDQTMLRPSTSDQTDTIQVDESNVYIVVHRGKMCEMWNSAFMAHRLHNNTCTGCLEWDDDMCKKWGLAWKVVLKCTRCRFKTDEYRLYEEVKSDRQGPKAATINTGLQVGLMKQGMSNTGMKEILTAANIPSPALTSMQRTTNKVGDIVIETNEKDMANVCENIKKLNEAIGNPGHHPIPAEADATYNNRIYSGVGNTPFQAGTQATLLVAENLTRSKKIIAAKTYSKLCTCYNKKVDEPHGEKCSANLRFDNSIGNEGTYLRSAIKNINDRGIQIGELTTDGDSSSRLAATQIKQPHGAPVIPKYCTRHLTRTLERHIKKPDFSPRMFPGKNKQERERAHNRFSFDLGDRVNAEFNKAFESLKGSEEELNKVLPHVCEAIIDCYRGDCQLCEEHSYVCSPEKPWSRPYLDLNPVYKKRRTFINAEESDLNMLREAIGIRISRDAIAKTTNNSTQNKCEASNRGLKKATPNALTFKRNYPARIHSAVHSINNSPGSSIRKLCEASGVTITNSMVSSEIEKMDKSHIKNRLRKQSEAYKCGRRADRQRRYQIYAKKQNEEAGYSRDGYLEEVLYIPPRHPKPQLKDHNYQTNKITVIKKK